MSGRLALVSGILLPVLVVLSWLSAMWYARRMRRAMQATPVRHGLAETGEQMHTIEDWLRRAAELPAGAEPRPPDGGQRDQAYDG